MLEDYIIDDRIRYENHYLKVAQTDIEIGGVTGAALLSALIVDTEEGIRRGIAIDSDAERMAWIAKYEREVRRDEWGLIGAEVELLNNAHIEIATSDVTWADICPNVRLLDLAFEVVTTYMHYLTIETFRNHIWEYYFAVCFFFLLKTKLSLLPEVFCRFCFFTVIRSIRLHLQPV